MLWVEPWGCWLMTRAEDVDATIRDTRRFSSTERVARVIRGVPGFEEGRFAAIYENFEVGIAQQDPPAHGRLRSLVSGAFTPRRVENLRPRIQALVDEMLAPHLATGRLELIADLADPLPAIVIAELAGFPVEDRLRFRDWTYRINNIFFGSGATVAESGQADDANAAVLEAREWIADLVADRRARPRDDLLTALAAAEHEGGRLSTAELLSVAITLFLGGHDTTTGLIGLGMNALLRAPDEVALLRERPDLVPAAVEEMLRYRRAVPAEPALRDRGRRGRRGERCGRLAGAPGAGIGEPRPQPVPGARPLLDGAADSAPLRLRAGAALLPRGAAGADPGPGRGGDVAAAAARSAPGPCRRGGSGLPARHHEPQPALAAAGVRPRRRLMARRPAPNVLLLERQVELINRFPDQNPNPVMRCPTTGS